MLETRRWYLIRNSYGFRLTLLATFLVSSLALPCAAQASTNVYLLYRQWQPYDWPEGQSSAKDVTRSQRGLGWHTQGSTSIVGLDYDYQPLRVRNGDPAHNGHLHRLLVGGEWQHQLYRLEARAGVAGTSNMFKYQDFHSDVVTGRIALFRALGDTSNLSLGIGGDHRFGSFGWLPRVRWEHGNGRGNWLVDLPVLIQWQSPGELWTFRVERDGDRWATLDKTREVEGALYLREWRTELTFRIFRGHGAWPTLTIGIGASFDTRVQYEDLNTGTVDLGLGDALLGSLRLDW